MCCKLLHGMVFKPYLENELENKTDIIVPFHSSFCTL